MLLGTTRKASVAEGCRWAVGFLLQRYADGHRFQQVTSANNCGKSLAAHATCGIKVKFKPTPNGAKSATPNVNGGGGGLRTVALAGTGT
jgi:hypothetical protein